MNFRKTVVAALAATTMLTSAGAAFAAPGITTGAVNFREDATTASDVIDVLAKGTLVEIEACGDGWCAIEHDGDSGYVSASYLALLGDDGDDEEDEDDGDDHDDEDDEDYSEHHDVDVEFCFGGGSWGGYGEICVES